MTGVAGAGVAATVWPTKAWLWLVRHAPELRGAALAGHVEELVRRR